jgi:prepilin-type N-terminal cleavage/methylation domain-containing protein
VDGGQWTTRGGQFIARLDCPLGRNAELRIRAENLGQGKVSYCSRHQIWLMYKITLYSLFSPGACAGRNRNECHCWFDCPGETAMNTSPTHKAATGTDRRLVGRAMSVANCKMQIANCKLRQGSADRGQENAEVRTQNAELKTFTFNIRCSSFHVHRSAFCVPRSAFTLIELLVTITIIGILTGLMLGALRFARSAAAEAQTKNTIAKLNDIVIKQYESYMTRRVPIDTSGMPPKDAAQLRLDALRDLMRMEMPERWSDVYSDPLTNVAEPALKRAYKQRYLGSTADNAKIQENAGPECLYLIVSMGNPAVMEQFSQNEIGDVDGDGFLEFIDGWGKPISFLRWAPGFNGSEVQANINPWNSEEQRRLATTNDHDPFDPQRVDVEQINDTGTSAPMIPTGWRLVPLIYSFGPDKEEGIYAASVYTYHGNPYESISGGGMMVGIGTPKITDVGPPIKYSTEYFDNITNHRIEQK